MHLFLRGKSYHFLHEYPRHNLILRCICTGRKTLGELKSNSVANGKQRSGKNAAIPPLKEINLKFIRTLMQILVPVDRYRGGQYMQYGLDIS